MREVRMFGYVKVKHEELRVKEYEFYKGAYCGLCHAMGKCTGQCSRMTLSYDFVFLTLVRLAFTDIKPEFEQKRCFVHPLKKRNSMIKNPVLDYCSEAAAILNYHKISDDLADEKGFKRLKARLIYPFVSHSRKKALKRRAELSELDAAVADHLKRLGDAERSDRLGVDAPAELFGDLLGDIIAFGLNKKDARIAFQIGKQIGAWIYIADAIDDMAEDMKRDRYNPFIKLYNGRLPEPRELELIADAVKNRLYSAEAALDLLDIENNMIKNIIDNVLYLGIPQKTDNIIKAYTEQNEKTGKEIKDD